MTKARSNPIAAMEEILTKSKESSRYFQSFLFMGNPLGYTSILGHCFYSICPVRLRDISSETFSHTLASSSSNGTLNRTLFENGLIQGGFFITGAVTGVRQFSLIALVEISY